jgi:hypothetical protein
MPELPKPRRVDMYTAKKYIREVCGLDLRDEVNPSFYDALCNDEIYFLGDLHTPRSGNDALIERNHRVAPLFWQHWGFHAFNNGTLAENVVSLPSQRKYDGLFYTNLTIETALIDTWLLQTQSQKVKVSAVPEKIYRERIEKLSSIGVQTSREEDRAWARVNGYSVESVDVTRSTLAPAEWQKQGRRSSRKKTAKETAE